MKKKRKYLMNVIKAGDTIEIYKTQSSRYGYKIPRSENIAKTPEDVYKNNQRLAEDHLRQLINANFKNDDLHAILKYRADQRPETPKQAQRDVKVWVDKMRKALKRMKMEFKYIYAVEIGERGAVHIHVVMNCVDVRLIRRLWGFGTVYLVSLYTDGQYRELANYIIKQTSKMYQRKGWSGRRYTPSKNLIKPESKKKEVTAKKWRKKPTVPKGYLLDPSFPLVNGRCEVTGIEYQRYGLIKIKTYKERYPQRREHIDDVRAPKPTV